MHLFGKILVWLLFPAAAVSTALLTRHLQIRNSYTQKIDSLRTAVLKNRDTIRNKKAELDDLEARFDRLMLEWQVAWDRPDRPNQPGTRTARAGTDAQGKYLNLSVGTQDGVGVEVTDPQTMEKTRQFEVLHIFRRRVPNRHDSVYVGRFVLTTDAAQIGPNSVRVYPNWNINAADWSLMEVDKLPNYNATLPDDGKWKLMDGLGPVWRIRSSVPEPFSRKFTELYVELEGVDRKQKYAAQQLAQARADLQASEQIVQKLEAEIAGADGSGGLVGQLRQAEEERNRVLLEVDQLRRQVKRTVEQRDALVVQNRQLAGQLPSPTAPAKQPPPPKVQPAEKVTAPSAKKTPQP